MKLSEILTVPYDHICHDIEIKNISMDTREDNEGGAFFCIKGSNYDAHEHIDEAVSKGAVAVIHKFDLTESKSSHPDVAFVKVDDTREAFAKSAEVFYGSPSSKMRVYSVTGTNGKTTTSYLMYLLLSMMEPSAYNGTIGTVIRGEKSVYQHLTTPDTKNLVKMFKEAVDKGCKSIAFELSSHALDMKRAAGTGLDVVVYTNLSWDHLDYHGNMDNYLAAKAKIFELLKPGGIALINCDDARSRDMINYAEKAGVKRILGYGKSEKSDYLISDIVLDAAHIVFKLTVRGEEYRVKSNLISEINCYNLCAAIASLHETGFAMEDILELLDEIEFNIGRFQYVKSSKCSIIVDFAHTPDGFEKMYAFTDAVRKEKTKVISVFGSAGKRDKGKRSVMGRIAAEHSDLIILTEDDNRDESPTSISREIAEGIEGLCAYRIIDDREQAIKTALEEAERGDIVLILGKGVEDFIYREDRSDYWPGDHIVAAKYAE